MKTFLCGREEHRWCIRFKKSRMEEWDTWYRVFIGDRGLKGGVPKETVGEFKRTRNTFTASNMVSGNRVGF